MGDAARTSPVSIPRAVGVRFTVSSYTDDMDRITVASNQMGGVPCIRGLRIPVATVVGLVADGLTVDEIVAELPPLEAEDVRAALRYAAGAVADREMPLRPSA